MWTEYNNKLQKEFIFKDFLEALRFTNRVARIAEKIQHHPEIYLTWGLVQIETTTHESGNIITEKDRNLSRLIDKIK
jgi:4a-hydroxytetrahydrobiopterin dehydratase